MLVTALWVGYVVLDARREGDRTVTREVTDIAASVAAASSTAAAVRSPDPTVLLQPVTEQIRQTTGVDLIVVMAPDRTPIQYGWTGRPRTRYRWRESRAGRSG
ncbi:hypothetical protein [Nocardia grenadensis]